MTVSRQNARTSSALNKISDRIVNTMNIKGKLRFRGPSGVRLSLLASAAASLLLAGCVQEDTYLPRNSRHYVPIPDKTIALMSEKSMTKDAPILIRAYKQESELEIWKKDQSGKYALLKTFPMCRWSGQLGPKTRECRLPQCARPRLWP